jgi:hypothetical protein
MFTEIVANDQSCLATQYLINVFGHTFGTYEPTWMVLRKIVWIRKIAKLKKLAEDVNLCLFELYSVEAA